MSAEFQEPTTFSPLLPVRTQVSARNRRDSADAFSEYLRRIDQGPLLSAADEVTVARRIEVGLFATEKLAHGVDDPELARELAWLGHDGARAKNDFIEANLRLVVSIAKRYSGRGTLIMDLVQDGNIGLACAVEKFDFTTGYKFFTYATWTIRQAIHRGIADKSRMIRMPVHTDKELKKIKRICRDLARSLGREPATKDLVAATHVSAMDKVAHNLITLLAQLHGVDLVAVVARTHPSTVRRWIVGEGIIAPASLARLRTLGTAARVGDI